MSPEQEKLIRTYLLILKELGIKDLSPNDFYIRLIRFFKQYNFVNRRLLDKKIPHPNINNLLIFFRNNYPELQREIFGNHPFPVTIDNISKEADGLSGGIRKSEEISGENISKENSDPLSEENKRLLLELLKNGKIQKRNLGAYKGKARKKYSLKELYFKIKEYKDSVTYEQLIRSLRKMPEEEVLKSLNLSESDILSLYPNRARIENQRLDGKIGSGKVWV